MEIKHIDSLDADFVVVLIQDAITDETFNLPMLTDIKKRYNLENSDFIVFANYGSNEWLALKKTLTNNTYFHFKNHIFTENAEVGDKIDFQSDTNPLYQITHVKRDPKDSGDINTFISLQNIKKDNSLGKLTARISHLPSPLNNAVTINFSRI
jgi:hypothetical protein